MPRLGTTLWTASTALVFVAVAEDAQAYLDPGTTSLILQAVVATIATGLLFFRRSWSWVKSRFTGEKPLPEKAGGSSSPQP